MSKPFALKSAACAVSVRPNNRCRIDVSFDNPGIGTILIARVDCTVTLKDGNFTQTETSWRAEEPGYNLSGPKISVAREADLFLAGSKIDRIESVVALTVKASSDKIITQFR